MLDQRRPARIIHTGGDAAHKKTEDVPDTGFTELARGRVLAIDYGRKRIGLAVSDDLRLTARPLATLMRQNRRDDLRRLRDICRNHAIELIIVGHPLRLTGDPGKMALEAEQFAARLRKELHTDVELVDERLTTWEAEQTMAEMKSRSRRKRTGVDDVAAAVMLRDYLGRRRGDHGAAARERD